MLEILAKTKASKCANHKNWVHGAQITPKTIHKSRQNLGI